MLSSIADLTLLGDNGSMGFWDYKTGYQFQQLTSVPQPGSCYCNLSHALIHFTGSLDSEAGILCSTFDKSGSRLLVGEADKSIKIYKEDINSVSFYFVYCCLSHLSQDAGHASCHLAAIHHQAKEVLDLLVGNARIQTQLKQSTALGIARRPGQTHRARGRTRRSGCRCRR